MNAPRIVLVVGGTSGIGRAVARIASAAGATVIVAGRSREALAREAADLVARGGGPVETRILDVSDPVASAAFAAGIEPLPDVVVVAAGVLPDPEAGLIDPAVAGETVAVNLTGPMLLLAGLGERFAARGRGTLVGVSSVAGDRGRARNVAYGAAKAGFTAALSGLRQRHAGSGVHVLTVKPGFVRTRMTEGMDLPAALTAEPEAVAAAILGAVRRRRQVIYTPAAWRLVMAVIRVLPEALFRRLRL